MNAVVTQKVPQLPVQYDSAVRALAECISIDEAKLWDTKADALAAWAKIYRNDEVGQKAKRLKLHAYRRMGQIAEEIQPKKSFGRRGTSPGANSLLISHGLKPGVVNNIRRISRLPQEKFERVIAAEKIPTPSRLCQVDLSSNPDWQVFRAAISTTRSIISKFNRYHLAKTLKAKEIPTALDLCDELSEWLSEFANEVRRRNI